MVSGFKTSPYDQLLMVSGDARLILRATKLFVSTKRLLLGILELLKRVAAHGLLFLRWLTEVGAVYKNHATKNYTTFFGKSTGNFFFRFINLSDRHLQEEGTPLTQCADSPHLSMVPLSNGFYNG